MAGLIHDYEGIKQGTKQSVGGKPKVWRNGQTYSLSWAFNFSERKACKRGKSMALYSPPKQVGGIR